MIYKFRVGLVTAVVVLELVLVLTGGLRVGATNTLLSNAVDGIACAAGSNNLTPTHAYAADMPASPSYFTFDIRCNMYMHPGTGTTLKNNLDAIATAIGGATVGGNLCSGTGCGSGAWVPTVTFNNNGSSVTCNSAAAQLKLVSRGTMVTSASVTVGSASNGLLGVNFFELELRCSDQAAWGAASGYGVRWSNTTGNTGLPGSLAGTANSCGVGGTWTGTITVCWGAGTERGTWLAGPPAWPDYWTQSDPPDVACSGIGWSIREDGVDKGSSLSGVNGDESKTYTLRVTTPTTGSTRTWDLWFDPDYSDAVVVSGRTIASDLRYLGRITVPVSGRTYVDFNVSADLSGVEDPTPSLGLVEIRCTSSDATGTYKRQGDGSGAIFNVSDPDREIVDDEQEQSFGGCFAFEGMSLYSPASWVRGAGRMFACLVEVLFVPRQSVLEEWIEDTGEFAEGTFPFSFAMLLFEAADVTVEGMSSGAPACFEMPGFGIDTAEDPCFDMNVVVLDGTWRDAIAGALLLMLLVSLIDVAWSLVKR